jgi:hypothetical protein
VLDEELSQLQQESTAWTYQPSPVRRVEIPKPDGKSVRLLGIPTVRDRVVQTTLKLLMEPIFDPHFSPHSYGAIRPISGAHPSGQLKLFKIVPDDFVAQGEASIKRCRRRNRLSTAASPLWWILIYRNSLIAFHDRLIARMGQKIADKRVLRLYSTRPFLRKMNCV